MGTPRSRLKTSQYSGYRVQNSSPHTVSTNWAYSDYAICEDVVDETDNQPCSIRRTTKSGGQLYGKQASIIGHDWKGYIATWQASDSAATSHLSLPTLDTSQAALDVIRRTNPSRASVDVMTQLAELKDAPSMMQTFFGLANDALEKAIPLKRWRALAYSAQMYLLYQFGIAPVVGDLLKLLEFQKRVDQRVKELERLEGRKGLRRTINLETYYASNVSNFPATFHSNGMLVTGQVTKLTTRKVTGHIRWYPVANFIRSDRNVRERALQAVSGNLVDFKTVYELIPWSWLVDYFTNLGDFMAAGRNSVEARHDAVRLMVTTETETFARATSTPAPYLSMTNIRNKAKRYERFVATPQLSARLEFLSGQQASIVGTLAVTRMMPPKGQLPWLRGG